jgi:uncharacterized Zn-finger protein
VLFFLYLRSQGNKCLLNFNQRHAHRIAKGGAPQQKRKAVDGSMWTIRVSEAGSWVSETDTGTDTESDSDEEQREEKSGEKGSGFAKQVNLKRDVEPQTTDQTTPEAVAKHMKAEKSHVCKTCGKAFAHGDKLGAHMRTHSGEKPYVCETCRKAFSEAGNLAVHMRTHTGEKSHVCKTCGKAFSQAGGLAKHLVTHSGEKPHVCKTCGKAFSVKCSLTRHMLTHTDQKPRR